MTKRKRRWKQRHHRSPNTQESTAAKASSNRNSILSLDIWRAGILPECLADTSLLWILLAALALSRWLAFPSTIWDQDEANFALAVLHFDPLHNQPHAPFFPLWIALGKMLRVLFPGISAPNCLQIISVIASVWIFFPLRKFWNLLLPRAEATAAAILFLFLPAPWLLSGRAYTEPTATAFFIAALAFWLRDGAGRGDLFVGGIFFAGSLLIRPQWVLFAIPIVLWRFLRSRGLKNRATVILLPVVLGLCSLAILVHQAGGMAPLLKAVDQHRKYIAHAPSGFSWTYHEFALNNALGGAIPGTLWMLLASAGLVSLLIHRKTRKISTIVSALILLPLMLQMLLVQNPTLPRYALPVLALSTGLVVAGIRWLVREKARVLFGIVGVAILASWIAVIPSLSRYRQASPIVAAFSFLGSIPNAGTAACDRRLVAFVTLLQQNGELHHPIIWDYQIELGMIRRPRRSENLAIFAGAHRDWTADPESRTRFECSDPLLRRVATPRFLDLTVLRGCAFVQPAHPSIRPEQLRPGAVIPFSPPG